ncbi:MAG: prepilin-type N-terminal cleavage/methylation domain-containing protein [Fusobacterium sp.]|nr:prepilin-type N-terminal cleavage/methylation domain-containing protein [Fusobacterium sp.]
MKNKLMNIFAGGGGSFLSRLSAGFTMAEILLSLTIIGVVAAITLPSLTGNINERTWNTQRKALYARMSQAISLMPALNGYGTTTDATSSASAVDTAAETFITNGLSKVLKINNICAAGSLTDCGLPEKITPMDGGTLNGGPINLSDIEELDDFCPLTNNDGTELSSYPVFNTKAAAFETANGESILVYYNPSCGSNQLLGEGTYKILPMMCVNFVFDLNGSKGPNTVGKDIGFMTAFYSTDSHVVAPYPAIRDVSGMHNVSSGNKECRNFDSEMRLPNIEELMSVFYNKRLAAFSATDNHYWTSSTVSSTLNWSVVYTGLYAFAQNKTHGNSVRCVKR